jgi:sec-independent protein translocase protein TatB
MDFGFSGEIVFLAFLALVLFGPRKLPQMLKTTGRFMAELKRASGELREQVSREVGDPELSQPAKALSSLADRIRASNAADNPAKAIVALAEPTQPKQRLSAPR